MPSPQERVDQLMDEVGGQAVPAVLLCDRYPSDLVAFTIVEPDLSSRDVTYGDLKDRSGRVAAALAGLGVGEGDRVATLMGKGEELVVTLLAIWRLGAVHVPLFTAFAPAAIGDRLLPSGTTVVVCDADQRAKLDPGPGIPADPAWRVVVAGDPVQARPGDVLFGDLLATGAPVPAPVSRRPGDPLIHLFTSGTTGAPKAVPVPVAALPAFAIYLEYGLDVRADDVFWNIADPGWAYGLYYGITGPLLLGRRNLLVRAAFDAGTTWKVLHRFGVTNFAAAPTVYRALRAGEAKAPDEGLRLRVCSSAGEPLNPEVIAWAERQLGVPIRDQYGQTELGMVVINGWHPDIRARLKHGSMGRPMPGFRAVVLTDDEDVEAEPKEPGRLAIDIPGSPLMWFTGYVDDPDRTAERFSDDGRWYLTGDVASVDEDGDFFYSSRDDDIIIMAGYRIGPFEVESALVSHPAVVDAAVVGAPDELRGEVVEAYVVLRDGTTGTPELIAELQEYVKRRYAAHAYPRAVHIVPVLPRTPSGKIQRFVLRDQRRSQTRDEMITSGPA